MSDNNNQNDEKQPENDEKQGLERFYKFDKEAIKPEDKSYFDKVKSNLQKVQKVKQKIQDIKQELQRKVAELQRKVNSKQPPKAPKGGKNQGANNAQNNAPEDMDKADLEFCKQALSEIPTLMTINQNNENTLQRILTTKNKESYYVIVDIALKPLPSARFKNNENNKNKDKDDKNKKDKQNKDSKNNNGAKKLTPKELQQLRMGKPLSFKPQQQQPEVKHTMLSEQQLQLMQNLKNKGNNRI